MSGDEDRMQELIIHREYEIFNNTNQKKKKMKKADPYLYFNGNTEEAFNFYKSVLNVEITEILRFGDIEGNPMGVPEEDLSKIAHIALPLGDTMLLGTDQVNSMGPPLTIGNNFYITLAPDSAEEAENVFNGLSAAGKVLVPLKEEFWAEKYGMCVDKFGVQWMINYEGNAGS
jgi:PhnB protein